MDDEIIISCQKKKLNEIIRALLCTVHYFTTSKLMARGDISMACSLSVLKKFIAASAGRKLSNIRKQKLFASLSGDLTLELLILSHWHILRRWII